MVLAQGASMSVEYCESLPLSELNEYFEIYSELSEQRAKALKAAQR